MQEWPEDGNASDEDMRAQGRMCVICRRHTRPLVRPGCECRGPNVYHPKCIFGFAKLNNYEMCCVCHKEMTDLEFVRVERSLGERFTMALNSRSVWISVSIFVLLVARVVYHFTVGNPNENRFHEAVEVLISVVAMVACLYASIWAVDAANPISEMLWMGAEEVPYPVVPYPPGYGPRFAALPGAPAAPAIAWVPAGGAADGAAQAGALDDPNWLQNMRPYNERRADFIAAARARYLARPRPGFPEAEQEDDGDDQD